MKFVVLGGIAVEDDAGTAIGPTSLRLRQLLGILLCHRGRRVTRDSLTDQMWLGDPPDSAPKNLQVYVHRLRRCLGPDRIEYAAEGYTLRCQDSELDAAMFDGLAQSGHLALANGDAEVAHVRLNEALAMWGGEPFADLVLGEAECPEAVRLERSRLVELQLTAEEDRADAALAVGELGGLIASLQTLLARHPLRERLRGSLMLALYRSARKAEALDLYRGGRALLSEELGIDPGPALQDLHQAILTDAPSLASPSRDDREPSVVPAELPRSVSGFAGRSRELDHLAELLRPSPDDDPHDQAARVITISGPGGIGKSALAVQAAGTVLDAYPDGQIYVNLRAATPGQAALTPSQVLARLLRSLGVRDSAVPDDASEAAARFRSLVSNQRVLVLLDDAGDAAQIRPVLPAASDSAFVITSRSALAGLTDTETHFQLDALDTSEATTLLANIVGPERVKADPSGAADVVRFCDRLPLALRIAAARLVARPEWAPSRLAQRLADTRTRLNELAYGDQAVASTCRLSHDALPPDTARVFELVGLLDLHHVTASVVAAVIDMSVEEARRHLDQLVADHLLQAHEDRHTIHDLVKLYAREQALTTWDEATRSLAVHRLAHHYLASERTVTRQLGFGSERRERVGLPDADLTRTGEDIASRDAAAAWVRSDADNIIAVAEQAAPLPAGADLLTGMSAASAVPFHSQGFLQRKGTLARLALESLSPERTDRRAMCLYDLGSALADTEGGLGEWRAHLRMAVELYEELGDQQGMAAALERWALTSSVQGDAEESWALLTRARDVYRRLGDTVREGSLLTNAAVTAYREGRVDEATTLLEEALELADPDDDRRRGITLTNLGELLCEQGRTEVGLTRFREGITLLQRAAMTKTEATSVWRLAEALDRAGHHDEAQAHREKSLTQLVEIGALTAEDAESVLQAEQPRLPDAILNSTA